MACVQKVIGPMSEIPLKRRDFTGSDAFAFLAVRPLR
jgi:hypothetical protein